jgi:hypothetical protein
VTYDDNVIDLPYDGADHFVDNIVTRVDGNTLIVDTEGSFSTTGGARRFVTVTTDQIEVIEASGGADVQRQRRNRKLSNAGERWFRRGSG